MSFELMIKHINQHKRSVSSDEFLPPMHGEPENEAIYKLRFNFPVGPNTPDFTLSYRIRGRT